MSDLVGAFQKMYQGESFHATKEEAKAIREIFDTDGVRYVHIANCPELRENGIDPEMLGSIAHSKGVGAKWLMLEDKDGEFLWNISDEFYGRSYSGEIPWLKRHFGFVFLGSAALLIALTYLLQGLGL